MVMSLTVMRLTSAGRTASSSPLCDLLAQQEGEEALHPWVALGVEAVQVAQDLEHRQAALQRLHLSVPLLQAKPKPSCQ